MFGGWLDADFHGIAARERALREFLFSPTTVLEDCGVLAQKVIPDGANCAAGWSSSLAMPLAW